MLFVDEIHRFNKAQQDAFLPYLEKGTLILVGATIENPSFYLNNALLSRVRVLKLNSLDNYEGELALAQLVIYLALAPKSNATYVAYGQARELASKTTHLNPPSIILNPATKLLNEFDYGKGYQYDHDEPLGFSGQNYFPVEMERQKF